MNCVINYSTKAVDIKDERSRSTIYLPFFWANTLSVVKIVTVILGYCYLFKSSCTWLFNKNVFLEVWFLCLDKIEIMFK